MIIKAVTFVTTLVLATEAFSQASCPPPVLVGNVTTYTFADGSIAMRTPLAVNPDGARASYMAGDSGFTYIANGVDIYIDGVNRNCSESKERSAECATAFLDAERRSFVTGTREFCAFAIEVDPMSPQAKPEACANKGYRIGNGKGKPRIGGVLETVSGMPGTFYSSTTALQHTVGGKPQYLDSATVPTMVVERSHGSLKGHVVWARSATHGKELLAVAGDTGPAFGEASLSVHQLLRYGELRNQRPGPIPLALRCGTAELALEAPFESRPDGGHADKCAAGHIAKTKSDIRAYHAMDTPVDVIILGKARYPLSGNLIDREVTSEAMQQMTVAAGYDAARFKEMAACIK